MISYHTYSMQDFFFCGRRMSLHLLLSINDIACIIPAAFVVGKNGCFRPCGSLDPIIPRSAVRHHDLVRHERTNTRATYLSHLSRVLDVCSEPAARLRCPLSAATLLAATLGTTLPFRQPSRLQIYPARRYTRVFEGFSAFIKPHCTGSRVLRCDPEYCAASCVLCMMQARRHHGGQPLQEEDRPGARMRVADPRPEPADPGQGEEEIPVSR